MTDAEIIKALECCTKGNTSDVCVDCPLITTDMCTDVENGLMKLALDLINRQKAEIERLKEPVPLVVNCEVTEDMLKTLRNQKVINLSNDEAEAICLWDKHVRTEAMEQFADKLQDRCLEQGGCIYASDIGAVLYEMAGEE